MANRTIEQRLRYKPEIDKLAARSVYAELSGIGADAVNAFETRLARSRLDLSQSEGVTNLQDRFARARTPEYIDQLLRSEKPRNGFGRLESGFNELGQLLPGGAGAGARLVGDITGTIDALPKFGEAVKSIGVTSVAAAAGIGVAAVALTLLSQNAQKAKEAALAELDARQRAIALLQTGNKEEIQARINQLAQQRDTNKKLAESAKQFYVDLVSDTLKTYGQAQLGIAGFLSATGIGAGELTAAKEAAEQAADALNDTNTELVNLEQGSGLAAQSVEELAAAAQKLVDFQKQISGIQKDVDDAKRLQELVDTGTSEGIQKEIESRENNIKFTQIQIERLERLRYTSKLSDKETEELNTTLESLGEEVKREKAFVDQLKGSVQGLVKVREDEFYRNVTQPKELAAATQKYNDDIKRITEQSLQQKAAIEKQYADRQVDIARAATEAAEDALRKLQESRSDAYLDLQRSERDAAQQLATEQQQQQIEIQRDEADALREHLRDLERIRRQAYDEEQDAILARDFLRLFQIRRNTSNQLRESNKEFSERQDDRQIQLQQTLEDNRNQFELERQQRLREYQDRLQDLERGYQRERQQQAINTNRQLQQAALAYNAELQMANSKYANEINMRNQAIRAELQLISQGAQARLQIEAQTQQALVEQARRILSGAVGSSILAGATSNTNSLVVNQTNNVSGASNPLSIANLIDSRTVSTLQRVMTGGRIRYTQ